MEYELKKTALSHQNLILHTQLAREETMEMIVPDAYPDIFILLETTGVCCLHAKEVAEGILSLTGQLRCTILYVPEEGGALHSLQAELPFQCSLNQDGICPECTVLAIPRILSTEVRAVNPRKIFLRVHYGIHLRLYCPETLYVPCGVLDADQVEERQEENEGSFIIAVPERRFQFRDQLTLSGSQPAMTELLRVHASLNAPETKLIGGKLVFKGDVTLHALYRSTEQKLTMAEFVLPYSQIMDAPEDEEAEFQLDTALLNWTLGELSGDGRSIAVELDLYACAELRTRKTLSLLTDAYSTHCATLATFAPILLPQLADHSPRRETRRELLETGEREVTVLDACWTLLQTDVTCHSEQVLCRATVQADLLCIDETGTISHLDHQLTLESTIPVTKEVDAAVTCVLTEHAALPAANGVELRVGVVFQPLLLCQEERLCVSALEQEEHQPLLEMERPSIVLRQMTDGETLWDIAKTYSTTIREIQQANEMDSESVVPGGMLLIPYRR